MSQTSFARWHQDLQELLGLAVPPVGIAFTDGIAAGVRRIERTKPPATADGRTGAVAASCVFWIEGTREVFATLAEDHGNCSVGSLTHGFKTMDDVAHNADVAALLERGRRCKALWRSAVRQGSRRDRGCDLVVPAKAGTP